MLFGEGAEHNTGGPSGVSERRWRFISSDTLSRSRRRVAFSNAAEREHASQPSLSQQIHKLEEELAPPQRYGARGNQQLFDRLPRSLDFRPIRFPQAESRDSRHPGAIRAAGLPACSPRRTISNV